MDTSSRISRRERVLRWLAACLLALIPASLSAAPVVPPRPENFLLDQGGIFPPAIAQQMMDALKQCAANYDVHIYVVTQPTLKAMPARTRERFDELAKAARTQWLAGQAGAVILFDDEAGWVSMAASDEAKQVFSPEAVAAVFKDPQLQSKKKHSAPEKLEASVALLIEHFTKLRARANDEARHQNKTRLMFGSIALGIVLAGVAILVVKKRSAPKSAKRRRHHRVHLQG